MSIFIYDQKIFRKTIIVITSVIFRAFRPKHLIVKYVPTELLRIIAKNELGFKIYFVVKSDIEVHFLYRL